MMIPHSYGWVHRITIVLIINLYYGLVECMRISRTFAHYLCEHRRAYVCDGVYLCVCVCRRVRVLHFLIRINMRYKANVPAILFHKMRSSDPAK